MKAEWTNKDSLTSGETTKAILVIDMPDKCAECKLSKICVDYSSKRAIEIVRGIGTKRRLDDCPLKHPLKSVDNDFYIYDRKYLFDNLDREINLLMSTKRFEEYMKAKGETE